MAVPVSQHLRNKGVVCSEYSRTRSCIFRDCPFAHLTPNDERPIPTAVCSFFQRGRCLRDECVFFHGSPEAFSELRAATQKETPRRTTYYPARHMEIRDPRGPAPPSELMAAAPPQPPMVPLPPQPIPFTAFPGNMPPGPHMIPVPMAPGMNPGYPMMVLPSQGNPQVGPMPTGAPTPMRPYAPQPPQQQQHQQQQPQPPQQLMFVSQPPSTEFGLGPTQ